MKIFYDERMLLHRIPDVIFDSLPSSLLEKQIELPEGADRIINIVIAPIFRRTLLSSAPAPAMKSRH